MVLSREVLLSRVWAAYNAARVDIDQAQTDHNTMYQFPNSDFQVKTSITAAYRVLDHLMDGIRELIDIQIGTYNQWYLIPEYLTYYTGSTELSYEDILSAWIAAPKLGRLMTVLTIDELRREVWDQEFTSYKIAPAGDT